MWYRASGSRSLAGSRSYAPDAIGQNRITVVVSFRSAAPTTRSCNRSNCSRGVMFEISGAGPVPASLAVPGAALPAFAIEGTLAALRLLAAYTTLEIASTVRSPATIHGVGERPSREASAAIAPPPGAAMPQRWQNLAPDASGTPQLLHVVVESGAPHVTQKLPLAAVPHRAQGKVLDVTNTPGRG